MVITIIVSIYLYTHQESAVAPEDNVPVQETGPLYAYSANGERGPLIDPTKEAVRVDNETGNAVLAEQPTYSLEYFALDRTFTIALLDRNLREARIVAERDLLTRFNLTEEQACSLNVLVSTIASVSQEFSGRQLGLSFCPGRVDLPTEVNDPAEPGSSTSVQPDVAL